MGLGVAQDEAQLRPRTPLCRPSTFKNEGQKKDPKKDTKKDDDGAKKEPRRGPKNHQKKDPKTDPNIIRVRFGSLRLSGVEARTWQAKMQAKS